MAMAQSNSMATINESGSGGPSPLCRCRVLYIGSAVPTITKDGLQGIQQPLRERYPTKGSPDTKGIDSWLSVWYNGLLLEYVEGEKRTESAFFPINSLHYCAAVRYVNMGVFAVEGGGERFIPLDSPFAEKIPDSPHPPIFAAIFRRTSGVKVLECHGFVCTNERAANALVRCCFHAYADTIYLKLDEKMQTAPMVSANVGGGNAVIKAIREPTSGSATPSSELNLSEQDNGGHTMAMLMEAGTVEWNERAIGQKAWQQRQQSGEYDATSLSSGVAKKATGTGTEVGNRYGAVQMQQRQHLAETMGEGGGGGGMLVPYNQNSGGDGGFGRRAASQFELRSSADPSFVNSHHHRRIMPPGGGPLSPFFFGPPMPPPLPPAAAGHPLFFPAGPPPSAFMRPFPPPPPPPPHFMPPVGSPFHPHHLFPPTPPTSPFHAPPHFGRIAAGGQFPSPFMMRHPLLIPHPPFFSPYLSPVRPKSPKRTGGGPIITETVYDTFPRTNRGATYEEPIYMPSSNNVVPPQASYKPGSFSPELYEHYYETYNNRQQQQQQYRTPPERKMSRSNSDASAEFWDKANGTFRKAHLNERAFGNTLEAPGEKTLKTTNGTAGDGGGGTLRARGNDDGPDVGGGVEMLQQQQQQQGTSSKGARGTASNRANRPETPPADYEFGTEMRDARGGGGGAGHRMAAY